MVGAKGLTSGYAPVGMVLASSDLVDVMWSEEAATMRHGYTYSGHPAGCAVALENLLILEEENLRRPRGRRSSRSSAPRSTGSANIPSFARCVAAGSWLRWSSPSRRWSEGR